MDKIGCNALLLNACFNGCSREPCHKAQCLGGQAQFVQDERNIDALSAEIQFLALRAVDLSHLHRSGVDDIINCRIKSNGINHLQNLPNRGFRTVFLVGKPVCNNLHAVQVCKGNG